MNAVGRQGCRTGGHVDGWEVEKTLAYAENAALEFPRRESREPALDRVT